MKNLIKLELERFSLKPHIIGLVIANIVILILCMFVSTFLKLLGDFMIAAGLPEITLTTVSLAAMLMRATLIVWQGVLIAKLIVEEYQNKTMSLLYTYPISRQKLIYAKIILISGIMLLFHVVSSAFQHSAIYLISLPLDFVSYNLDNVAIQLVIIVSTMLLAFIPLSVGMVNKSTIATVVTSVIIVALSSNSQGSTAGLLSIPIISITLGFVGLAVMCITIKKMTKADLSA